MPEVRDVAVDPAAGRVRVEGTPDRGAVGKAIREAGYEVEPA